jgi:hypothetical protein
MSTTAKIRLDQKAKTLSVDKLSTDDSILFELMDGTRASEREEMLAAVLHIGALAMQEDRIHSLIAATEKELFPKLERFKRMFEARKLEFEKTTQKGEKAEVDIVDVLNEYIEANGWSDHAEQSGKTKGAVAGNKTGDVLCVLEFDEDRAEGQARLAIEVKFDKSVDLGDPLVKDVFIAPDRLHGEIKRSGFDTAWSQLLETRANRDCPFSMIVVDQQIAHPTVLKAVRGVAFLPGIPGFVVVVDSQSGDYSNLLIAYRIARDLALYYRRGDDEIDVKLLETMIARIIHFLGSAKSVTELVKKNTAATVKMNQAVQSQMSRLVHMAEFTQAYLRKFLQDKTLSAKDLTEFYYAAEAKVSWRQDTAELEAEIKSWTS